MAIAAFVLTLGISDLLGSDVITHHDSEIILVGLVPLFLLLDGLTRVHLVLRRAVNLSFGGTLRILGMWFSVKFSNARAALKGALGFTMPFVRTSKRAADLMTRRQAFGHALRLTPFESTMALLLLATGIAQGINIATATVPGSQEFTGRLFLIFWLAYYALVFTAAPLYAYKSFTTRSQAADADPAPFVPEGPLAPSSQG